MKVDPHIAKVVGKPVPCMEYNVRHDNEASKRSSTVKLGDTLVPDTQRLGYGVEGVAVTHPGGGGLRKSQEGKASPNRGRSAADSGQT